MAGKEVGLGEEGDVVVGEVDEGSAQKERRAGEGAEGEVRPFLIGSELAPAFGALEGFGLSRGMASAGKPSWRWPRGIMSRSGQTERGAPWVAVVKEARASKERSRSARRSQRSGVMRRAAAGW